MARVWGWLKRHFVTILLIFVLVAGLGLASYPMVSNLWNEYHQATILRGYAQDTDRMGQAGRDRLLAEAEAYNSNLAAAGGNLHGEPSGPGWDEYNSLLNSVGDGVMGYVEIPDLDVRLAVYHGTEENVLQIAAGHLYGSSLPVGGMGTHCVLSGHTGLPRAMLFTGLEDLEIGDTFRLITLDRTMTYEVDQIKVVRPENLEDLAIDPDRDLCTLVTCTPYGVNSHRLLVRGTRIPNPEDMVPVHHVVDDLVDHLDWLAVGASATATLVLLAGGLIMIVHRKKGGEAS